MNHSFDFSGKVAFISGASSGIGRATAMAFGQAGATLVLADIDAPRGKALADQFAQSGVKASFVHADLTDQDAINSLFNSIADSQGRLDIAHNNVGFSWGSGLLDINAEEWDKTVNLCMKSPFLCMQREIALMRGHGGGVIVNTASMAGVRYSWLANAAYSAAKAGLIHLTRYAAMAHAADNIRVNAVSPALTRTEAIEKFLDPEQQMAFAAKEQPIGRPILPEEIAANVLWLCSDASAMVTGENMCVAGGSQAA